MAGKYDDVLIGRAILTGVVRYLKDSNRHSGLDCTREQCSHIDIWKRAMTEGREEADSALEELVECPLCSSIIATFQARKLVNGIRGRITGGLTRSGAALRRKRFPPLKHEATITSVIDDDIPF